MKYKIMQNKIKFLMIGLLALGACATKKPVDNPIVAPVIHEDTTPPPKPPEPTPPAPQPVVIAPDEDDAPVVAPLTVVQAVAEAGDRVFFDTNSFTLTDKAREVLGKQAAILRANPNVQILIDGNCDERGTREYNLALGAKRANAAKAYLVALGVKGENISTVSYGKERPIDDRPSEDGWAINRNAHTNVR